MIRGNKYLEENILDFYYKFLKVKLLQSLSNCKFELNVNYVTIVNK